MHFLLMYEVVDGYIEKRKPHRAVHFVHAQHAYDAGELVLAGALDEPVDGAVFVFRGDKPGAAERFAENDPYVKNGLVKAWRVRKWTTVLGDGIPLPKL
jgi:uncharacterized protein YciI